MDVLNEVINLKNQGMSDTDISTELQNKGVSPVEISDALNQAEIKTAVSQEQPMEAPQPPEQAQAQYPEYEETQYPQYSESYNYQGYNPAENTSEIAQQVVDEKFAEFEKRTGDLVGFKNEINDKIEDINTRLKRIETTIDKLQQAIVSKIGEFGESTKEIHKDLQNLHNTTSKLMNPLIDNYKELQKLTKGK
jgi:chromosome segregation ATPase